MDIAIATLYTLNALNSTNSTQPIDAIGLDHKVVEATPQESTDFLKEVAMHDIQSMASPEQFQISDAAVEFTSQYAQAAPTSLSSRNQPTHSLRAFNLVGMAYQGYFRNQGIPGYAHFLTAVQRQQITEDDLIQAAIATGRVSSGMSNNSTYHHAVRHQMRSLSLNRKGHGC